jgi:tetratricopeptide (TPR) repeat protein
LHRRPATKNNNEAALDLILQSRELLAAGRASAALPLAQEALRREPRDADALHVLGEAHYRCGELAAAEARLRQAIQANGRAALYHHALGNVLQDRGALQDAIQCYRRAIRLKPDFAEPHNDLGTAYFAQGDAVRAAEAYLQAARLRPDHAIAQANLGSVYRKLGLPREARRALQREFLLRIYGALRKVLPTQRRSLVAMARAQLDQGNPALAARIAQKATEAKPDDAAALAVLGMAQERLGATGEALASFRAAVALKADDAALRGKLGGLLAARGDVAGAVAELEESVRLQPRSPGALTALAELQLRNRNLERGEQLAREAARLDPRGASGHFLLGEALFQQGRAQEAEQALRVAIALDRAYWTAQVRLADLLRHAGRLEEAEACLREALSSDEESAPALVALAMVLRDRGRTKEAIAALEEALRIEPGRAQALQLLGDILRHTDRITEAEQRYREGLKARPGDARLLVGLALVLGDQVRYAEAFSCIEQALKREPGSGTATAAKALLLDLTGRWREAEEAFAAAINAEPHDIDIAFSRATCRLRHGDFARGWKGFELRRQGESFVGRYRKLPFSEWQGEPLEGKTILVYPEQGLGDEIMYASCLAELSARAHHVALECDPKLGELFARSFPQCTVTPRPRTMANDWVNNLQPRPDYQVPIGSLPLHFRLRAEQFPEHRGYLVADPAKVAAWKRRLEALGPGPKIGLSWRGGVGHTGKARRSLTLEQLRPVLQARAHFVNLQYTDVQAELVDLAKRHGIRVHHWQEAIDDYDETAALVCALDRVVTVCTSLVHLTGALGRRAVVMVPYGSDWRYGAEGSRMRWYPSVELVRQTAIGEWANVLETVRGLITRIE